MTEGDGGEAGDDDQRLPVQRRAGEEAERQGGADVDDEDPEREPAVGPGRDLGVDREARRGREAAQETDRDPGRAPSPLRPPGRSCVLPGRQKRPAAVVAEKGHPDTTVAEIVERASTSQRTFYEHFKNKEDAIVAALDSGSAHMLAAALPAFRRAPDWPHAVHDTQEAMFCFGAEEPE